MATKKKSSKAKNLPLPPDPYGSDGFLGVDANDEVENPDNVEILKEINQKYTECRADTVIERLDYWMNYAFWRGDQWLWIPSVSKELIEVVTPSVKRRREQATVNKVEPAIHTTVSKVQEAPLGFEVQSESADDYTSTGARKGEAQLRSKVIDDEWERLGEKFCTTALLGGYSALSVDWDATANRYTADISTGDCSLSVMTPESMYVEPGVDDATQARWWIKKLVLPPSSVKAEFGLDFMPQADGEASGPFSVKAFDYCRSIARRRGTQVLWYYERPNPLRPNGLIAVVVNNRVVFGPVDYTSVFRFDHLNLHVGGILLDPERWTYKTPVSQALGPQRQINHLWTKIHETLHRTSTAKLIVDKRHSIPKSIDDDPETPLEINYVPDAKEPHWMTPPSLPPNTMNVLQELNNEIEDILGVHAVSQGQSPANVESGLGIQLLAEQDSTPAGKLAKERARVFGRAASDCLELWSEKVTDTRTVSIYKGRGVSQPVEWTGKDLAGQTRAVVPNDSIQSRSHAAQMKMATDLLQMKPDWFPTFSAWAKFALLPGFESATEALDDDTALAEWENWRMSQGIVTPVNPYDDDLKHIAQHVHEQKSPAYRDLPRRAQAIFRLHLINHRRQLASKAAEQEMNNMQHPALGAAMSRMRGMPGPSGMVPGPQAPPQPSQAPEAPPQIAEQPQQGALPNG